MSKIEAKTVNVDCIITYQDKEQEFLNFDTYIQPINHTVNYQRDVEVSVLTRVISKIKGSTNDLVKISLCLIHSDFGSSDAELDASGFGFNPCLGEEIQNKDYWDHHHKSSR